MPTLRRQSTGEWGLSQQAVEREIRSYASCGPVINYGDFGFDVVFDVPKPTHTRLQRAKELPPQISAKGTYEQVWEVVDLEKEMKAEDFAAFQASLAEQDAKDESTKAEARLKEIDLKCIRSLRDGDTEWIEKYKQEAAIERAKVVK